MLSLGAFAFAAPGMLALLLVLPAIYFLLRLIPPLPKLVRFPAIRLLIGLEPSEQTPAKMPWWLLLLRMLLAAALILAVARPLLNPQAELPGRGPLLLVIDDGWSSAPGWTTRIAHAERLIQRAERGNRLVALVGTAPQPLDAPQMRRGALRPEEARTILRAFRPKPWPTDRAAAVADIDQAQLDPGAYAVWLSDGLQDAGTDKLTERLRRFSGLEVVLPDQATTPLLLLPPVAEGRDLKVRALRAVADGPRKTAIQASDDQGRVVARIDLDFAAGERKGEGVLPTPPELRNRMTRLDIETQGGAGSTVLLDERNRRRPVSVLGERETAGGQPLLQEVYFLEKALDPYVSLSIGDREAVLTRNTAVLLIPDSSAPSTADREEIAKWIENGGVAVRFAGPNLAAGGDSLVPTPLRLGDRSLGGVMSWGAPSALAEFPANSPFLGIPIPKDVRISQQVLAEPTPDLADKTWARLADGTPLVTGEKRGKGYLVLIHTTANTNWSNLALSGLFVDMLQRLVLLSRGVAGDGINKALKPWRTLDGFGRLVPPPAGVQMLQPDAQQTFVPKPTTPPGFYGDENAQVAFNIGDHIPAPAPLVLPAGVTTDRLSEGGETDLARWCLMAAAILLLLDLLISLWLRGLLPRAVRLRRAAPVALLLFAALFVADPRAQAQTTPAAAPRRRSRCRPAKAFRAGGAEGRARRAAGLHRHRRQGCRRDQQGGPRGPERDPAQPHLGRAGRSDRPRPREGRAASLSDDLLGDHLDAAHTVTEGRGGARPLPAHRRHPARRHARPADELRQAGQRQSRPQAPAGRHRDAAADRHAARPRADQVVLPAVRHAGPLAGRQALDRGRRRTGE
jgi:hypothetical protein